MATDLGDACRNYRFARLQLAAPQDRQFVKREVRHYRHALERNQRLCREAATLVRQRQVEPGLAYAYVAFAQQAARVARKYVLRVRQNELARLLRRWQGEGLSASALQQILDRLVVPAGAVVRVRFAPIRRQPLADLVAAPARHDDS